MKYFFLIGLFASALSATRLHYKCADELFQLTKDEVIEYVARPYGQFLTQHLRLPTHAELATNLNLSSKELTELAINPEEILAFIGEHYPALVKSFESKVGKKILSFFKSTRSLPTEEELGQSLGIDVHLFQWLGTQTDVGVLTTLLLADPSFKTWAESQLVNAYLKCAREMLRPPSIAELSKVSRFEENSLREILSAYYPTEGLLKLKELAIAKTPSAFKGFVDTDVFNEERTNRLKEAIEKRSRLVVVTAVAGAPVDIEFFNALLRYCRDRDAEILVIPANMETSNLDEILLNTPQVHIVTNSINLNPWLQLNNIKIMAKHIWPLQGLDRIEDRRKSLIVGSPKIHMQVIPTKDNHLFPRRFFTTGSITKPYYQGKRLISARTDKIATSDHKLGGLVLEKSMGVDVIPGFKKTGDYHLRHIEYFSEAKGFVDLGVLYTAQQKKKMPSEALVLGDAHVGDTDQILLTTVTTLVTSLKPKQVVLHDVLNGHSINDHEKGDSITLAKRHEKGQLDLREELNGVVRFINALMALDPKLEVVIVHSNHNYWLHRWLKGGKYVNEPHNKKIGIELAHAWLNEGIDPLKYYLMKNIEYPKRLVFKDHGETHRVGPQYRFVELGEHGDKGANGGKGSLRSYQRGYDRSITGHRHTTQRLNDSITIGTITEVPLAYSKEGLGNWQQTSGVVDAFGGMQVLEFIQGTWFNLEKTLDVPADQFFLPNYPEVIPNEAIDSSRGQLDQYGS